MTKRGAIFRQPVHGPPGPAPRSKCFTEEVVSVQNQKGRINHGLGDGHQPSEFCGGEVGPVVELGVIALGGAGG